MVDSLYIQLLGYIALVLGGLTYLVKKQNKSRIVMGSSQAFMGTHFWLLGGYTAALIQFISAIRTWMSNFVKTSRQRHTLFYITAALIVIFSILTWSGIKSIVPTLAGLNASYAICYLNNKKMKKMLLISAILWFINGILWNSIPQIVTEFIKFIFNIYTILSMTKNNEFTAESIYSSNTTKPIEMTYDDEIEEEKIRVKLKSKS